MALQEISDNSIQQILAFRTRFEVQTGVAAANVAAPAQQEVHKLLADFVATLDVHGFTQVFDTQAFLETVGTDNANSAAFLATVDADTLRKLITAHIRMERFVRGHLQSLVANGYFLSFFNRLQALNA
jgi:hypothetical protein